MAMDTYYDTDAVLERLLHTTKCKRDAQLATLLGVSPQAISQARKKQRIPESWLVRLATRHHVSLDWLLYGDAGCEQPVSDVSAAFFQGKGSLTSARPSVVPAGTRVGLTMTPHQPMIDSEEPVGIDVALIPLVAANLSAGGGSLESGAEVLDYFAFRQNWLCRKGDPERMVLMKVHGDSMEPNICHGDMVLIDQGKTRILGHTIYAVGVNEEIYVKQIETLPGNHMLLRSLNERYEPIEIDLRGDMADSVRIIGKVIWWCREA